MIHAAWNDQTSADGRDEDNTDCRVEDHAASDVSHVCCRKCFDMHVNRCHANVTERTSDSVCPEHATEGQSEECASALQ